MLPVSDISPNGGPKPCAKGSLVPKLPRALKGLDKGGVTVVIDVVDRASYPRGHVDRADDVSTVARRRSGGDGGPGVMADRG
jgi:hypothetical protein